MFGSWDYRLKTQTYRLEDGRKLQHGIADHHTILDLDSFAIASEDMRALKFDSHACISEGFDSLVKVVSW